MTEMPSAASFPVVFFDGDRDVDVGAITVTPSTDFSKFQAIIAQKIRASPHQISISLVRRKKARSSPEIRRKVPIDEFTDFKSIFKERDCFFLVMMRRSRRERRGRGRRGRHIISGDEKKVIEMPEKTILKRNQEESIPIGLGLGYWDYQSQWRNLQRMRDKYLQSTAPYYAYTPPPIAPPVCEECVEAKREARSPVFHWCVYDEVTFAFRSPVGPIERPTKKNIEASA